jgi:hypothetical protein
MTLDPIITHVAHTGADELRFRGYRVFGELLGTTTTAQMLALGISGHLVDAERAAIFDDVITVMSSADPRMWPFKITRLASAHGVAAYGVAATLVAAEGGMFGPNRMRAAARWLIDARERLAGIDVDDDVLEAQLDHGTQGFGVLYRSRDERFEALMKQVALRGRSDQPFTQLCNAVVRVGRARRQLEPHVFLGVAAVCLDLDLPIDAISAIATILLFHDALANAVEGAAQAPKHLQVLPLEVLDYRGPAPRASPRSEQTLSRDL